MNETHDISIYIFEHPESERSVNTKFPQFGESKAIILGFSCERGVPDNHAGREDLIQYRRLHQMFRPIYRGSRCVRCSAPLPSSTSMHHSIVRRR